MEERSARRKLAEAPPGAVYPLEGAKAARFGAWTMLVPSPVQIGEAIRAIPIGQTRTIDEIRGELAAAHGAEVTCPRAMTVGWFMLAQAAEEALDEGEDLGLPWWRLLRGRKLDPRLPGGGELQKARLIAEGVKT